LVRQNVTGIKGIFHMLNVLNRPSLAGTLALGAAGEAWTKRSPDREAAETVAIAAFDLNEHDRRRLLVREE
jgi:hypothetical protein